MTLSTFPLIGWGWPRSERSRTAHLVQDIEGRAVALCGSKNVGGQVQNTIPPSMSPCMTCLRFVESHGEDICGHRGCILRPGHIPGHTDR